jgi:Ricin-type beta-trefoil lectin domain
MKRIAKGSAVIFAMALALTGSAFWVSQSGAAGRVNAGVTTNQPAGINFGIHPRMDMGFCLEDTTSAGSRSPVSIQQCGARDSQDWVFAQTPSGSRGIIDGSGLCLQFAGIKQQSVELTACTLKGPQQFLYSATGQITSANGKYCLQDEQAASGAAVTMPKCVVGLATQIWILSR